MRFSLATSKLAFVGSRLMTRQIPACQTLLPLVQQQSVSVAPRQPQMGRSQSCRLFSSGEIPVVDMKHINKDEMKTLIDTMEEQGREKSKLVIMDVREANEILNTGPLSPNTIVLHFNMLSKNNVFALDEDDFEEMCGFEKPKPDETLVFSCAAGARSAFGCQLAGMNGYTKVVNYVGGANEWFQ